LETFIKYFEQQNDNSKFKGRGYVDHFLYVLGGKFLRSTINVTQKIKRKQIFFQRRVMGVNFYSAKAFNIKKTQIYIYKIILLNYCQVILLCICIPFQKQPKKERKNV
jgi:hypothetical protein